MKHFYNPIFKLLLSYKRCVILRVSRNCILSFKKMEFFRECNGATHSDLVLPLGFGLSCRTLLKLHREAEFISDRK